jgi:hypothetical protein
LSACDDVTDSFTVHERSQKLPKRRSPRVKLTRHTAISTARDAFAEAMNADVEERKAPAPIRLPHELVCRASAGPAPPG